VEKKAMGCEDCFGRQEVAFLHSHTPNYVSFVFKEDTLPFSVKYHMDDFK
jgi:hypothetical protein